jgi:hypothetical protein
MNVTAFFVLLLLATLLVGASSFGTWTDFSRAHAQNAGDWENFSPVVSVS